MNFKSKIEAYKLLRKDDSYLILNISDEYNDEKTVNVKETNKHDNLKKKKKNIFEKMKTFINLNKNLIFTGSEKKNWFCINKIRFSTINNVYSFLFLNKNNSNNSELKKIKQIFSLFNNQQLNRLNKNVKSYLSK